MTAHAVNCEATSLDLFGETIVVNAADAAVIIDQAEILFIRNHYLEYGDRIGKEVRDGAVCNVYQIRLLTLPDALECAAFHMHHKQDPPPEVFGEQPNELFWKDGRNRLRALIGDHKVIERTMQARYEAIKPEIERRRRIALLAAA